MVKKMLLCDFHIHTQFSDGALLLENVISLYGQNGFDAICISDHILDEQTLLTCQAKGRDPKGMRMDQFDQYLHHLWEQARKAWEKYNMLVIPGTELTNNTNGYHILAIDIKKPIEPGLPVEQIIDEIHRQGGVAIAPHPHRGALQGNQELMYLWDHHEAYAKLFDAWEVANRDDIFNVVGLKKFNYIANSDFHEARHLYSWKTLLQCNKNVEAIKSAIRKNENVSIYLFREDKPLPMQPEA